VHIDADAVMGRASAADQPPEVVLVAGLAHDLQVLLAFVELHLHAVVHPGGSLIDGPDLRRMVG
jgi:hypothetical protein